MKKIIDKYNTIIKYILSAGFCFVIDLLLFTIFNHIFKGIVKPSIILATILARIMSSFINYLLNRNRVFNYNASDTIDTASLSKYITLVIIQMLVSSLAVTYIYNKTLFNESLIKIPVDICIFVVNYIIQKKFIFNNQKKERKDKSNLVMLLYAILTSISFIVNPIKTTELLKVDIRGHVIILAIFTIFIYFFYKKYLNSTAKHKTFSLISIIFTLLLIIGYSFNQVDSGELIYGNIQVIGLSIVKLFGYNIFINLVLNLGYEMIDKLKFENLKSNKYLDYFKKYPFKTTFIILFIIYGIYLIAFYPGVVGYDPSYQIKEVLGIPNFYSESVNITNANTLITQFNPIIHTLLIGGLFKLGSALINANFGIFLYTLVQVTSLILALSYTIKFMFEEKVPEKLILATLIIYIFVPFFPFYSISAFKDTYYAIFFILFVIGLYKFVKYDADIKSTVFLALTGLGLCLFRLNGYTTVILSTLFLFFGNKKNIKYVALAIVSISLVYFGYKGIINYLEITPTSFRELISVPIQQTSALITKKEEVIEPSDRQIIGKIIDYDAVKENYNPELSDPVKNTYNKDATNEDVSNYFKVWFKYLFKEPLIYTEATINNIYGYYYPEAQKWYFYYKKYSVLNDVGIDYHYNGLKFLRTILYSYGFIFQYAPILSLITSIGLTTWIYIYLIGCLINKKKTKYIKILIPAILTILMCTVGPINTYYRYVIPYSMSLPTILCLLYNEKDKETANN